MADIIGMGFDKYVQDQVLKRQEKLRYGQTDLDVIRWNNTNNAFLRLTSGVNVSEDFVKNNLGLDPSTYKDSSLAKYFKLFAAQAYDGSSYSFTKGVGYSFQSSYGFTSPEYTSYGLVPPPGLISANIKALNRGSLREATIQIQCNNLQQFQIIEALYLRLKYSILLEWGHSLYFDNDGNLTNSRHDLSDEFLDGVSQTNILKKIQDEREASDGNYDAFFGLVTNFEWTVRPDGGYDITLIARAAGDVIESLKLNTNTKIGEQYTPPGSSTPLIDRDRYKTTLNRILYAIAVNVVPEYTGLQDWADGYRIGTGSKVFITDNDTLGGVTKLTPVKYQTMTSSSGHLTGYEAKTYIFNKDLSGGRETHRQHYIKLGTLLRIIDSFLTIYDDEHNNDPLFKIDYNFDTNFCFTIPDHISIDPKVCLIPYPTQNTVGSLASGSITFDQEIYDISYTQLDANFTQQDYQDLISAGEPGDIVDLGGGNLAIVSITKSSGKNNPYNISGISYPSISTFPQNSPRHVKSPLIDELRDSNNNDADYVIISNKVLVEWSKKRMESAQYQLPYVTGFDQSIDRNQTLVIEDTNGTKRIAGIFDKNNIPSNTNNTIYRANDISRVKRKITVETFYNTNFSGVTSTSGGRIGIYESLEKMNNSIAPPAFKDLSDTKNYIARTMHIHVNMEYICKVLADNYNIKTGELNLYKFLEKLMNGIQNALGNINNFEIIYKEDTNTFKIIDNTFIPGQFESGNKTQKTIVEFLISANDEQGTKGGSFVKNINFRTKLSNAFATMTTIGAQKNGAVVGSDSTALSKWNNGLEDRIIKTRTNPNGKIEKTTKIDSEFDENRKALQELISLTNSRDITDNHINQYKNSINDYFKARISSAVLNDTYPGIGFIPFDLEINMMGLSGPRIYESYTIDTKLLPKSYQDAIQFICSGVSHNISNGEWTTTLNSICGPKQKGITVKGMDKLNLLQVKSTGTVRSQSSNPDEVCGASTNNVNTKYPKSVKFGGKAPVIIQPINSPTVTIQLASQPVVSFSRTTVTQQDYITAAEQVINQLIPGASKDQKLAVLKSAYAISLTEQRGKNGGFRGFNNNISGVESSGFQVFNASDVNGKVQATEGGTGIKKFYYSFSNVGAGLVPLISKIIERNMFDNGGGANEWAWRSYRDWNGYGARTKSTYISDCADVKEREKVYNEAVGYVNQWTKFK